MARERTYNTLQEVFYEELGQNNMNLLWHLKEIMTGLPVKHILDVGAGMRVSRNICLPESSETALIIDPDRQVTRALINDYQDNRIEAVEGTIETTDLGDTSFDLVFFIMSLLWIDDPMAVLKKVTAKSPLFIVISNPEFSPEQQGEFASYFGEHATEFTELLEKYHAKALNIDAIMESYDYYPLEIFHTTSWRPTPEHRDRTVLYTKEKPDRSPYEKAKFIIQVNSVCNCNCPSCYVDKTGEHMDVSVFKGLLEKVHEKEIISLRGGEPTLTENLIEDFVNPALRKGIHVILESNGLFIGTTFYQEYLKLLTHKNIELRLSLDRQHLDLFKEKIRQTRIGWISQFIGDAKRLNIRFGLYALGMYREQIKQFLEEYSVESWMQYIRPLTRYSDIAELPINGKFVDVEGNIHDYITGIGWIGTPDEKSAGGFDPC